MKKLLARIRKILRDRRTRHFLTRFVSITAAIVVFVTTYALVLPAITMEREAYCGLPAHEHDDNCYEKVLICHISEGEEHQHSESCYEKELACGLEAHIHTTACYNDNTLEIEDEPAAAAAAQAYSGAVMENGGSLENSSEPASDFEAAETNAPADKTVQNSIDSEEGMIEDPQNAKTEPADEQEAPLTDSEYGEADSIAGDADMNAENGQNTDVTSKDATEETESQEFIETEEKDDTESSTGEAGTDTEIAETGSDQLADESETDLSSPIADTYVPALEALDFNTILTSSTGIYYYHKADEAAEVLKLCMWRSSGAVKANCQSPSKTRLWQCCRTAPL